MKQNEAPVTSNSLVPNEVSASDILNDGVVATATPEASLPPVQKSSKKEFMVESIFTLNKICGNYFNRTRLKKFERECLDPETSEGECSADWNTLQAELLGKAKSDDCRNEIFNATNQLSRLQ